MYTILTIGAGRIGATFAKEMARFIACYIEKEKTAINMVITDYADVKKEDVGMQYTAEDVGWNKAAAITEAICDTMGKEGDYSFPHHFHAFNTKVMKRNAEEFWDVLRSHNLVSYKSQMNTDSLIIVDCCGNANSIKAAEKLYELSANALIIRPVKEDNAVKIAITAKLLEKQIGVGCSAKKAGFTKSEALVAAHSLEAVVLDYIINNKVHSRDIVLTTNMEGNSIRVNQGKRLFVCVGAGGTGGDFIKEFAKELLFHPDSCLLMIDGDKVEEKNRERQPFSMMDLQQNKAVVLRDGLFADYPELNGRLFAFPNYIETVEDLEKAIESTKLSGMEICLLGCVDNNRARQVLHMYYAMQESVIYVDSGNEFDYGQVVTAVKKDGKQLSPTAGHYFHEMLTDAGPSASELSCGNMNVATPQHQITNLTAADILFSICIKLLEENVIHGGITYFDVFDYMRKFRPVEKI